MRRTLKILSHPAWAGIGVIVAVILFFLSDVVWPPGPDDPSHSAPTAPVTPQAGVTQGAAPPGCAPRPDGDFQGEIVQLTLSDHSLLTRAGASCENIAWVIERDGEQKLERLAASELQYRYFRSDPGLYCAHIRCRVDGQSRRVSGYVTYTMPE